MSDEKWLMEAYYYSFVSTGVDAIDRILSAVAVAGKGCHNTEDWGDYGGGYEHLRGNNFVEMIQNAAIDAADEIERLEKEMRGWSKAAMNLFNSNATLIATLEYLRTQAKNGTLHPQVVILNADKALGEIKLLEGKNGLRN